MIYKALHVVGAISADFIDDQPNIQVRMDAVITNILRSIGDDYSYKLVLKSLYYLNV